MNTVLTSNFARPTIRKSLSLKDLEHIIQVTDSGKHHVQAARNSRRKSKVNHEHDHIDPFRYEPSIAKLFESVNTVQKYTLELMITPFSSISRHSPSPIMYSSMYPKASHEGHQSALARSALSRNWSNNSPTTRKPLMDSGSAYPM